jgi:hypothetical protein
MPSSRRCHALPYGLVCMMGMCPQPDDELRAQLFKGLLQPDGYTALEISI